jgi:hypothetical protein
VLLALATQVLSHSSDTTVLAVEPLGAAPGTNTQTRGALSSKVSSPDDRSPAELGIEVSFHVGSALSASGDLPPGVYVCVGGRRFFLSADEEAALACADCYPGAFPYCSGDCPPPGSGQVLVGCIGVGSGADGRCSCMYIAKDTPPGGNARSVVAAPDGGSVVIRWIDHSGAISAIENASPDFPVEIHLR